LGLCAVLESQDKLLGTYRGHGLAIARGSDPRTMMAELLGKEAGLCKGRGGSMHLSDTEIGFLGSNAIVAAHIPIAGGVALAQQMDEDGGVTVCCFGDGASCEGVFYETCNMAALWKLPLIFVVENNEFAISTHVSESISVPFIAQRAQAFGFPGVTVDGTDVFAVAAAASEAVQRARSGEGPTLIEAKTVRWSRHSAVSAGGYGRGGNVEKWKETDPLPRYAATLIARGLVTQQHADEIEGAARREIEAAVEFAIASPTPRVEDISSYVYA
jgi:pyruvate dehydrogenase E1 component alpha subunit